MSKTNGASGKEISGKAAKARANGDLAQAAWQRAPDLTAAAIADRLGVWWLNGKDHYFIWQKDPETVFSVNEKDVKRELRLAGVFSRVAEGKTYSQIDLVMKHIQRCRYVEYAGPLAGRKMGRYTLQGRRILVTSSPQLIEPKEGDFSLLWAMLTGMFKTEECDQTPYFFAWLKTAIEALREGQTRPGHALIMAGPSDCGKSLIQEHVITPLLGGRSADPTKFLLGKTNFNSELGGAEHLAMQELPSALDFKSRVLLGEELKRLIATESHSLQQKYCDALTLNPWWRVTLSLNNTVDKLKALPALTSDFADKVLLLLCEQKPMPMPTFTVEEREAFRTAFQAELPAFVDWLLRWEIPDSLRTSRSASRFGHDCYHHPKLTAALFEQEPQSALLYILDNSPWLYIQYDERGQEVGKDSWGWHPAEALREQLCDESQNGTYAKQASKIFNFAGACGAFLSKLAEKFPDRFKSKHTRNGNVWMIQPPVG